MKIIKIALIFYTQFKPAILKGSIPKSCHSDDDDDDEGRINFSVALSPKTTRTRNNKPKQWSHVIVVSAMRRC